MSGGEQAWRLQRAWFAEAGSEVSFQPQLLDCTVRPMASPASLLSTRVKRPDQRSKTWIRQDDVESAASSEGSLADQITAWQSCSGSGEPQIGPLGCSVKELPKHLQGPIFAMQC